MMIIAVVTVQWKNTGGLKQKHKKQPFGDASAYEVGGIAKRIKTARLRRKTKPGRDVILHVRP
ncbi:MAG: hypothetical protein SPE23_06755 [Sodaliphilus sp.]|nr:hypothetical protein [Sodaliphilus sp.]